MRAEAVRVVHVQSTREHERGDGAHDGLSPRRQFHVLARFARIPHRSFRAAPLDEMDETQLPSVQSRNATRRCLRSAVRPLVCLPRRPGAPRRSIARARHGFVVENGYSNVRVTKQADSFAPVSRRVQPTLIQALGRMTSNTSSTRRGFVAQRFVDARRRRWCARTCRLRQIKCGLLTLNV